MNAKRAMNIAILAYFCAVFARLNTMYGQYKNIASDTEHIGRMCHVTLAWVYELIVETVI